MLNFNPSGVDNAVVLCSLCHVKFDMMGDPGWVFYPADLDYFIRYETDDYDLRLQEAARGIKRNRSCPTAADYSTAQKQSGHLLPDAVGGLYRRVFLRRLHPHIPQNHLAQERSWSGAPIAALRQAIHATGSLRVTAFPPDDLSKLRTLQALYARPDPDLPAPTSASITRMAVPTIDTRSESPPPKRRCLRSGSPAGDNPELRSSQAFHTSADSDWILGPQMSTEELVIRYASVF